MVAFSVPELKRTERKDKGDRGPHWLALFWVGIQVPRAWQACTTVSCPHGSTSMGSLKMPLTLLVTPCLWFPDIISFEFALAGGLQFLPQPTGQLVSNVQWLSPALSQALPGLGLGGTESHPRLTLTQVVLFAMNYSLFVLIRSPLCPQVHRTQLLSHFNWSLGIQAGLPKDVTKNQDPGYLSRSRYNTGGCRSQEGSWRLQSRVSSGIVVGMFPPPRPPQVQKGSQWSPHFHPLRQWREKLQGDHSGAGK